MFFFPNQGNPMLKTLLKQQKNPYCKVLENRSYLLTSFDPELFLPSSLSPCLWVMRQVSQDQRAARVCCPWGCSRHLLHKLDGRQGGGKGWGEAQLKASWTTAAQLLFCHRQVLWTKGFMGSFHPHMPHLHTLAPPDVVVLSSSTWHQLFPEHIQCFLAVCVQTSQIPKIVYRKMSSGRLIILYSNRAL